MRVGETLLLGVVVLLIGAPNVSAQLEVEERWSTKGPANTPFTVLNGAAVLPDGRLVVSDENHGLFVVASDGTQIQRIARIGQDPNEVRTPGPVARDPRGGFAVYDVGQRLVAFYNADLREVARVQLPRMVTNPKGFAVRSDGSFVVSGGTLTAPEGLHFYSADGKAVASFEPIRSEVPSEVPHVAGGALARTDGDTLVFSNAAFHRVVLYPPGGAPRVVAQDSTSYPSIVGRFYRTETRNGVRLQIPAWYHPQSRGVFILEDGTILNVVTRRYDSQSRWEVWSTGGTLRERSDVPVAYTPFDMVGELIAALKIDPLTDEQVLVLLGASDGGRVLRAR